MFSTATRKSVVTALTGAALASALIVSGASADEGYQDLRSPDAVDAARAAGDPPRVEGYQDLRSPDTRDHAEDYQPTVEPQPSVDEPSSSGGFDLASAGIGAAAGTGVVILLLVAGGLARRHPPNRRHGAARA
ncbi:MAG: hypothetical protein ACRDM7_21310 [Thermoleophilaceae bacterium]